MADADVILALDADFLGEGPGHVRYQREFSARRRPVAEAPRMNRLYAVEAAMTITGAAADHRWPLRPSAVGPAAWALAGLLGVPGVTSAAPPGEVPAAWLAGVADDLRQHGGRSLVIAGDGQPPAVHALAHALNAALGNTGRTVTYHAPAAAHPVNQAANLRELAAAMEAGAVETLLMLGGNPAYSAPADVPFRQLLLGVPLSVHLSETVDETSAAATWHAPRAHTLESWGDARAFDGTASLIQPLIAPMRGGLTAHEFLARAFGEQVTAGYDLVRGYWQSQAGGEDFEAFWRTALHDGVIAGSAPPARRVGLAAGWAEAAAAALGSAPAAEGMEVIFKTDASTYDGRLANNAWLQELPRPITTLTWDNAALLAPATAAQLGVTTGSVVEVRHAGRTLRVPALAVPGHAPQTVTLHLGYGRTQAGRVGNNVGANAYALRTAGATGYAAGVEVGATAETQVLAFVQNHHLLEGRDLLRHGTLAEFAERPDFAADADHGEAPSLYRAYPYPGERWGMAIDLSACTGCQACVIACQAENNIPVVGRAEVARGREMHWLRVDSYFSGEPANPQTFFQPVPCMHCEKAPCEPVCPVGATVHSSEGLNDMIYNRCVGTRYCSNNCPYKVRRFNFFDYPKEFVSDPQLKLLQNPSVSIRSRGVMEKCTYCVQRIRAAQSAATREGRAVGPNEVITACQGACPTGAIVFGDLNQPESAVARLAADPRNYALLSELGTQPRTTYLAALRNPNPALEGV
jgi:molybdopterin-containing oxidoreductase family iron-sulfur binding subunit